MWATANSTSSSRSSAKNVDLRSDDGIAEPKPFPRHMEMWMTKQQRSRTSSIQSDARSDSTPSLSRHSSMAAEEFEPTESPFNTSTYDPYERLPARAFEHAIDRPVHIHVERDRTGSFSGMTDASHSTLAEEFPRATDHELKTPIVATRPVEQFANPDVVEIPQPTPSLLPSPPLSASEASREKSQTVTVPKGPLEQQLLSLLSRVSALEHDQPTVMAEDYQQLETRVVELEFQKQSLQQRHEALYALRDEDVANLVQIRGLLAHERREHEALRQLRDEDLQNVIDLRNKLAQATWSSSSSPKESAGAAGTITPTTGLMHAKRLSQSTDLWLAAKTAAMEQKVLELERANTDLRSQLDRAHTALLTSTQQSKPVAVVKTEASITDMDSGIGALFENVLRHRERLIVKIERMRAENDGLRKDLSQKEDETAELEHTVEKLRMKIELGRTF